MNARFTVDIDGLGRSIPDCTAREVAQAIVYDAACMGGSSAIVHQQRKGARIYRVEVDFNGARLPYMSWRADFPPRSPLREWMRRECERYNAEFCGAVA